jgi:argininosuccinate lyase
MSDTDKLWGGRFAEGPSEVFKKFSWSLRFDRRLIGADIRGSQAFARALERVGILTPEERARMVAVFDEILAESSAPAFYEGAEDEDVHSLVIRKLKEKAGALAGKIHTGRSRNEQVSLDTRLWLRGEIESIQARLVAFLDAMLALANRYPDAVIPGYTHLRRAQAVLWPHYILAYFEMFLRDWERLEQARNRVNLLPLGSGALAGSGFPFDREAIARDLGFAGVTRNSMDVSADRDFVCDFLYAAALAMIHLSRLAEDWILYSSDEFGWIDLADGVTSGSSLMPQKKNPDSLELIRGKCGRVAGSLNALLITMKGLPLTYNRGSTPSTRPPCRSTWRAPSPVPSRSAHPSPPPRLRKAGSSQPTSPKPSPATASRSIRPTSLLENSSSKASTPAGSPPAGPERISTPSTPRSPKRWASC